MKAAVFRDGALVVDRVAAPEPSEGQVAVKSLACGICGSDLHYVHHSHYVAEMSVRAGMAFPFVTDRDVVMGHEFCGEVMEATAGFKAGTRVCSVPFTFDATGAQFVGYSAERPGGFGQVMVLNAANLLEVPNGLSAAEACLTEPMAVGWHAVGRGKVEPGDVALVVGCGPIGLAVVAALKVKGVGVVIAAGLNPYRRQVALAMGADVAVDPAEHSPFAACAEAAEPPGWNPKSLEAIFRLGPQPKPTVIFECVGVPGMVQQCFAGAMPGARVVVVGVCMQTDAYEPLFALNKELNVHYAFFYSGEEYGQTLRSIAEGRIDVTPMISRTVGLSQIVEAFDQLSAGGDDIKVVVDPWT